MRTYSKQQPQEIQVNELPCGVAEVLLAENAREWEGFYEYDLYIITTPFRQTLMQNIIDNTDEWFSFARRLEEKDG